MADGPLITLIAHLRRLADVHQAGQRTDAQLLEAFADRHEEAAFEALIRRHGPLVWQVCRHVLGRDHDAEDAFQATFLVLARKAGSVRRRAALGSWLYGVALRIARKARGDCDRQGRHERQVASMAMDDPLEEAVGREHQRMILDEVDRLPEKYRLPILLCGLQGLTNAAAARQLGWAVGTVKTRLMRARELLRKRLARRGLALSAGLVAAGLAPSEAGAAVPAGLVAATVKAGAAFALGKSVAAGAVSAQVVLLAEGGLRTLLVSKVKVFAVLLGLCALSAGAGVVSHQVLAGKPAVAEKKDEVALHQPPLAHAEPIRKEEKRVRLDRYGDPLPDGAVARLGTLRLRKAQSIALSPDGKTIASDGTTGTLRLWNVATGREMDRLEGLGAIQGVAYSSDGKIVAGINYQEIILWDQGAKKRVRRFPVSAKILSHLAFSPDNRTLAYVVDFKVIGLWDTVKEKEIRRIEGHEKDINTLAFTPDGWSLISASLDNTMRQWSTATGKEERRFQGRTKDIEHLALSPDGKLLATVGFYRVSIWDFATGKELRQLEGKSAGPPIFTDDGRLVAGGGIWDVRTGKKTGQLDDWMSYNRDTIFCRVGKTLVCSGFAIRIWDLETGKERRVAEGHQYFPWALAFSPNGQVLASASFLEPSVFLWQALTGKQLHEWEMKPIPKRRVNNQGGFLPLPYGPNVYAFSPDGKTLAVGTKWGRAMVDLWDLETGKEVRTFPTDIGQIEGLAFSPDGQTLAAAGEHTQVVLWNLATGKEIRRFEAANEPTKLLAFSADGQALVCACYSYFGGRGFTVFRWDVAAGKELRQSSEQHRFNSLALTPDGETLAISTIPNEHNRQGVYVWDVASGEGRKAFEGRSVRGAIALSPDGRLLAAMGDKMEIWVWELATKTLRRRFPSHPAGVYDCLVFSPDGRLLATGGMDTTILIWDLSGRSPDGRLQPVRLSPQELTRAWADLAAREADQAQLALWALVAAAEQTVPFLQTHLRPASPLGPQEAKRVEQWISQLDSGQLAARKQALDELAKLNGSFETALRQALGRKPSLEVRRHITSLLEKMELTGSPELLRELRAVEVLEHIATPAARQMLEGLTRGLPEARLTQEAKASLVRLARRLDKP